MNGTVCLGRLICRIVTDRRGPYFELSIEAGDPDSSSMFGLCGIHALSLVLRILV